MFCSVEKAEKKKIVFAITSDQCWGFRGNRGLELLKSKKAEEKVPSGVIVLLSRFDRSVPLLLLLLLLEMEKINERLSCNNNDDDNSLMITTSLMYCSVAAVLLCGRGSSVC